jgi:hypothetical protein
MERKTIDRNILPVQPPPFTGRIGMTYADPAPETLLAGETIIGKGQFEK